MAEQKTTTMPERENIPNNILAITKVIKKTGKNINGRLKANRVGFTFLFKSSIQSAISKPKSPAGIKEAMITLSHEEERRSLLSPTHQKKAQRAKIMSPPRI